MAEVHRNIQHDEVDQMESVSNDNATETLIFDIETVPLDENLVNPLHDIEATNIVHDNEQMSSYSWSSNRHEWIRIMNKSDLVERQIFLSKKELYSKIRVFALYGKFQFR